MTEAGTSRLCLSPTQTIWKGKTLSQAQGWPEEGVLPFALYSNLRRLVFYGNSFTKVIRTGGGDANLAIARNNRVGVSMGPGSVPGLAL